MVNIPYLASILNSGLMFAPVLPSAAAILYDNTYGLPLNMSPSSATARVITVSLITSGSLLLSSSSVLSLLSSPELSLLSLPELSLLSLPVLSLPVLPPLSLPESPPLSLPEFPPLSLPEFPPLLSLPPSTGDVTSEPWSPLSFMIVWLLSSPPLPPHAVRVVREEIRRAFKIG